MIDCNETPDNRLSVCEAAALLNCSAQVLRKGLQQGVLKFGFAIKASDNWTYIITKQKFEEVTGIKVL